MEDEVTCSYCGTACKDWDPPGQTPLFETLYRECENCGKRIALKCEIKWVAGCGGGNEKELSCCLSL